MEAIAIIPARGGSVGLPKKNVRPLLGIPLIARTIQTALGARQLKEVYVSTDDEQIAKISKEAGASVINRPATLSHGTASSESALLHALDWIDNHGLPVPQYLVMLQCTSPFTRSEDIDAVLETLVTKAASCALSVVEDHGFIWQEDDHGFAEGITHDYTKPRLRRQDMKQRFRENGAIYAMRVADFVAKKERFCGPVALVPVQGPSVEIDSQQDWDVAEAYLNTLAKPRLENKTSAKIRAVITDFDGVHTDDRVTLDQNGKESVSCSRRDGLGLEILRNRGIRLMILSKETNPVVIARAEKLRMSVINQIDDKLSVLDNWRLHQGLHWGEIAFIGNDINAIDCMNKCGLSFAPSDAHDLALQAADVVLTKPGGHGAIREMCDFLISGKYLG